MAVSSIAVPPDPKRDARAAQLVALVPTWPKIVLKRPHGAFPAGTVFRRATGSKGDHYVVSAACCTCPDYAGSGNFCKHARAVALFEAMQRIAARPRFSRPSYADLFPPCRTDGCNDVADGQDGYCSKCASDREWQARHAK